MCTARKTNRRSLEVYFDDRCQFSTVRFRSDSVQVCDLGSSKKGKSLKKKIQSRWGGGDRQGERSRRPLSVTAPWLWAFLEYFINKENTHRSVHVCICQMSQLSLRTNISIALRAPELPSPRQRTPVLIRTAQGFGISSYRRALKATVCALINCIGDVTKQRMGG